MLSILWICLVMLLTQACASQSTIVKSSASVRPGMSKVDLQGLMGAPKDRQFHGENEAWQYCSTGSFADHYVLVWLFDGVVTGMQTYRNTTGVGNCESFFRTINWEDAPDAAIEIRQR
jgi:hypothetical protein